MTKRALGPGAVCCEASEACEVGCYGPPPADGPTPVDTEVDAPEPDPYDEEDDE